MRPGNSWSPRPGTIGPSGARAYLFTDQVVTETAARYAGHRPELDAASRRAIDSARRPHAPA